MRWLWPFIVMLVAVATGVVVPAVALEIEQIWNHRAVTFGWYEPPASVIEGSITGTFVGDEPLDLVGGDPRFERVTDFIFRRQFTWNETDPVLGVFQGRNSGQIDSLWAIPSPEPTLVPGAHGLPVLNITSGVEGLWSHATGLYVWGVTEPNWDQRGNDWERSADLTIWDAGGAPLVDRPVGLRINGGWTRCLPQKSLRLYLDRDGQEPLVHDFFGDGPTTSARLMLRQTVWSQFLIKDHWATSLYRDLGHLTSRWTPCVAYLNGEYWGAYALRERLDDEWATVTLGLDADDIDMVKDGETIHGDPDAWPAFLEWADTWTDPAAHTFFVEAGLRLDLEAYTDWLLINIIAGSGENGFFHNLVLVHLPDGRWRTVMWDQDNIIFGQNIDSDLFHYFSADDADEYASYWPAFGYFPPYSLARPYCRIFSQLMGNAEYRTLFAARARNLLTGPMSVSAMEARMDSVLAVFAPEVPLHASRFYPYSDLGGVEGDLQTYKDILGQRHPVVVDQLDQFLDEHMAPVELSAFTATQGPSRNVLNWRTERERDNAGFEVWRAVNDPQALTWIADYTTHAQLVGSAYSDTARTYRFEDTAVPFGATVWYQLRHVADGGQTVIHDWLALAGQPPVPDLVVNEFLADNDAVNQDEMGEFDDWLELYNAGPDPVDLEGLYLTDDLADLLKWPLPAGRLEPGGHLLVWCDEDADQGPLHASFKLAAGGEFIGLFTVHDGEPWAIDLLAYGPQTADVSQGRLPDGGNQWEFFPVPTPGAPNIPTAAPNHGLGALLLRGVTPNPGDGPMAVRLALPRSGPLAVDIHDLRGRRVRRLHRGELAAGEQQLVWDRRDARGRLVAAGVYLLRVQMGTDVVTAKLAVVR